jgi:NADPH:quinone reductase-like Zn-dependent oxidoreductase
MNLQRNNRGKDRMKTKFVLLVVTLIATASLVRSATMKASVAHEYGGPEVLKYEDTPQPYMKEDEMLVRVIASGVNPIDAIIRSGKYAKVFGTWLPLIPGYDIAGVVEQAGPAITKFKKGDPVYAYLMWGGGCAEFAVTNEGEAAAKPKSLTFLEAAGVPLAALTAWQALVDSAKARARPS